MKTLEQLLAHINGIQEAELNHLAWLRKQNEGIKPLEVHDSMQRLEGRTALVENILKFVEGDENGAS